MKLITVIYCLVFFPTSTLKAQFSFQKSLQQTTQAFKKVTSWVTRTIEATSFEEYPLEDFQTVILENSSGTLSIKGWSLPKVAVEAVKTASEKDINSIATEAKFLPNQLVIKATSHETIGTIDYQLMVPINTNIIAKTNKGSIKIKNIHGALNATAVNGSIDIQQATHSLQAVASGPIIVDFSTFPLENSVILKSIKSNVTLTLPANTNATINATTTYNSITSQHTMTLQPITLLLNKQAWESLKKQITGIIGNGGASLDISAYSGITIYNKN